MKGKEFDCVEFKHKLHREAYKESGVKTLKEYISYVNLKTVKPAQKSRKATVPAAGLM